jgi:hypothetical protein
MIYCGNCHYNLDGLDDSDPCPECGSHDRINNLPPKKFGYHSLVAVCLYLFFASTALFVYGAGPFTIAGNGSTNIPSLPVPFVTIMYGLSIVSMAYVLSQTVFAFDPSKLPKWNRYILYPLNFTLSIFTSVMLNGLLWVLATLTILFLI